MLAALGEGTVAFMLIIILLILLAPLGKEIFEIWKLLREYNRLRREDEKRFS